MACESLIATAKACGKNTKDGVSSDVFLISFNDLKTITGTTEVYATTNNLISQISFVTGSTKFVKYGTVVNQAAIKETFSLNENGTYDIVKELTFTLADVGSVASKQGVEKLISNPVAALVKLQTGTWVAFGLNGLFQAKSVEGAAGTGSNGRVVTLSGSDTEFLQPVDPTIIAGLLS